MAHPQKCEFIPENLAHCYLHFSVLWTLNYIIDYNLVGQLTTENQLWHGFYVPNNVTSSHRTVEVQKPQSLSTCAESQRKGYRLILQVRCNFKPHHESVPVYPTLGNLLLIWSWFQFIHFRRSPLLLNEIWLTNRQVQPCYLRCPRGKFQGASLKVTGVVVRTRGHADQLFYESCSIGWLRLRPVDQKGSEWHRSGTWSYRFPESEGWRCLGNPPGGETMHW